MSLKDWLKGLAFVVALGALSTSPATADDGSCGTAMPACSGACGWPFHCPGPYTHYTPKIPCIKYKCACGKPLCNLCDMQGYGYHPTCWRPWDQPLNYNCVVPTPTQLVQPPMMLIPAPNQTAPSQAAPPEETLPIPDADVPRR